MFSSAARAAQGHDSRARLRGLEETQWLPGRGSLRCSSRTCAGSWVDIGTHVPYYRELFGTIRFVPESVQSLDDLAQVPFLTKALIRGNEDRLKARDAGKLIRYNTGGSSGEPLVFYMGPDRVSHDVAAKWRATRWWGVDIGDPEIVVWGSPIELNAQDRVRQLRDRLLRTELLPAFDMSEANLDRFIERIKAKAPEDAVRLSVGARVYCPPRRAPPRAPRRPRDQGCIRHVGMPVRPSAPADREDVRLPRRQRLRRPRRRLHRARVPRRLAPRHG